MVEVGVAAGGTTVVIQNCISILKEVVEIYSIDISEKYYEDKSKKTGYLINEFRKSNINHKMFVEILPEYLDVIENNIDLLILDTMHFLLGKILDFLACFPKLKDGPIVVLHDTIMNHLSDAQEAFATKMLLGSVVGEKILCKGDENPCNYPGIGAFQITKDTGKYIENVFFSLSIT